MHVVWGQDSVTIHQSNYASRQVEKYDLGHLQLVATPCDHRVKLQRENNTITTPKLKTKYLQKFGSANYLPTLTRPDLAYALSLYGRFNANPVQRHMDGLHRAYAYINATPSIGIMYTRQNPVLTRYVNAN